LNNGTENVPNVVSVISAVSVASVGSVGSRSVFGRIRYFSDEKDQSGLNSIVSKLFVRNLRIFIIS
jgi:hypothetical protein